MVFQYPEYQLFEETVVKDIAYGPRRTGVPEDEIDGRVHRAMALMELDYDGIGSLSPFELSGGQKRRVAIAGVLAMEPKMLILDEPVAGLDPKGRAHLMSLITRLNAEGATILMITHSMDDIAENAHRVLVLSGAKLLMDGTPAEVFSREEELRAIGLDLPAVTRIASALRARGLDVPQDIITLSTLEQSVLSMLGGGVMIKNMTLGQYFPGNSIIHRLDARAKLMLVIALIVAIFMADKWLGNAVIFGFIVLTVALSRVSIVFVLRGLKPLWFIIVLTFVLNTFFYSGGTPLFTWWIFRITQEGLSSALWLAVRLVFLITATTMLTLTTTPIALTDGLESLMKPLKAIRFPVHELAMMMTIAMRFIPTLLEETDKIMKAQTARGAEFDSGSVIARAKGMVPLLVPLFVSAFRRAYELADAMESRCYHGGEGRTRMKVLHYHLRDLFAALLVAGLVAVMAVWF